MEYDLIYKVETGYFGNRCEVVEFRHWGDRIVVGDISIDRGYTSYIVSNVIFIGKNRGYDRYIPDKTRVLKQFKVLAKEKSWKIKVIWNDEEHYFNYNCSSDELEGMILKSKPYFKPNNEEDTDFGRFVYGRGEFSIDELENKNISEEECKMGVKKEVEIIRVSQFKGELFEEVVFDDTIQSYSEKDREVIANNTYNNVIQLKLDGEVIFEHNKPTIKVIDEREEYIKAKIEYDELSLRVELGLIPKTAEISGKLEELLVKARELDVTVRYELDWGCSEIKPNIIFSSVKTSIIDKDFKESNILDGDGNAMTVEKLFEIYSYNLSELEDVLVKYHINKNISYEGLSKFLGTRKALDLINKFVNSKKEAFDNE